MGGVVGFEFYIGLLWGGLTGDLRGVLFFLALFEKESWCCIYHAYVYSWRTNRIEEPFYLSLSVPVCLLSFPPSSSNGAIDDLSYLCIT